MSEGYSNRSAFVTSRRLQEAMDKLDKHHPHIASRLRTVWRREDEAWARGEMPLPLDPMAEAAYYDGYNEVVASVEPLPQPSMWERWRGYWHRF